jgi:hypothetical protein
MTEQGCTLKQSAQLINCNFSSVSIVLTQKFIHLYNETETFH